MKKHSFAAVTVALLLACLSPNPTARARQLQATAEEYAVYSAAVADMFAGGKVTFDAQSEVKLLVIEDQTATDGTRDSADGERWKFTTQSLPSLTQGMIDDYAAKNREPARLERSFDLKLDYTLVDHEEIRRMFGKDGGRWKEFYQKFPGSGGFVSFSRVGFDADATLALLYMQHGCGGLCGTGHYLLLRKGEGGWKIEKKMMAWIS